MSLISYGSNSQRGLLPVNEMLTLENRGRQIVGYTTEKHLGMYQERGGLDDNTADHIANALVKKITKGGSLQPKASLLAKQVSALAPNSRPFKVDFKCKLVGKDQEYWYLPSFSALEMHFEPSLVGEKKPLFSGGATGYHEVLNRYLQYSLSVSYQYKNAYGELGYLSGISLNNFALYDEQDPYPSFNNVRGYLIRDSGNSNTSRVGAPKFENLPSLDSNGNYVVSRFGNIKRAIDIYYSPEYYFVGGSDDRHYGYYSDGLEESLRPSTLIRSVQILQRVECGLAKAFTS